MKQANRHAILAVILISAISLNSACSNGTLVNGSYINSAMSDQEIVSVFGIDTAKATRKDVKGKDGTSVTYTSGQQEVTITRSTVSGVTVMAGGPISGLWPLDKK